MSLIKKIQSYDKIVRNAMLGSKLMSFYYRDTFKGYLYLVYDHSIKFTQNKAKKTNKTIRINDKPD